MFVLAKLRLVGLALVSAITLTLMSCSVERKGPELAVYGNMCGPHQSDLCYKPELKGGFPIAYVFVHFPRQTGHPFHGKLDT